MAARTFMGRDCYGPFKCAACGRVNARKQAEEVILDSFTAFERLLISGGTHLCDSCANLLKDKHLRYNPVLYIAPGEKQLIPREDILPFIKQPLTSPFVLSLPYSYKKHHWLSAGLSSNKIAYIGTDTRTVKIDYSYPIADIIAAVQELIHIRIPRKEIATGEYSVTNISKFVLELEEIIKPFRYCGAIELFVNYSPAVEKDTKKSGKDFTFMLTKVEEQAVSLLRNIAVKSPVRTRDGILFWNGLYPRYINRYKELSLKEFISRLCENLSVQPFINLTTIEVLSDDECEQIMAEIRQKAPFLLSIAFSRIKRIPKPKEDDLDGSDN